MQRYSTNPAACQFSRLAFAGIGENWRRCGGAVPQREALPSDGYFASLRLDILVYLKYNL